MAEDKRRFAPATERNRAAILEILAPLVGAGDLILEIGSGTGEHAAWMTPRLDGVSWQPSNPAPELNDSVTAWAAEAACDRILPPLLLDVLAPWPDLPQRPKLIFAANVIHISPFAVCRALFAGAARVLAPAGHVLLYGPYRRNGRHTAPSNAAFDQSLQGQNAEWGVRDISDARAEAKANDLMLVEELEMPANNLSLIFAPAQ